MNFKIPSETILKFLDNNNIEIKETSDDEEIRINSIYDNDNKFKLYISLDKNLFHCFKTGEGGRIEKLLSDVSNIDEKNIVNYIITNYFSKNEVTKKVIEKKVYELELPENLKFFKEPEKESGLIMSGRKRAYNYLAKRGLTEDVINELGYITNSNSMYNNRIFIPFYEEEKLVYFQTRDFTNTSTLRYVNPKGFSSKEYVYNIDKIENEVVIVEGLFDAMSVDNIPATAIMSADLTLTQAKKIMLNAPKEIIFIPDNDETGGRTLSKNIELMNYVKPKSLSYSIWLYYLPDEFKDFNEYANKTNNFKIDKNKLKKYNKNTFFGNWKFSFNKNHI